MYTEGEDFIEKDRYRTKGKISRKCRNSFGYSYLILRCDVIIFFTFLWTRPLFSYVLIIICHTNYKVPVVSSSNNFWSQWGGGDCSNQLDDIFWNQLSTNRDGLCHSDWSYHWKWKWSTNLHPSTIHMCFLHINNIPTIIHYVIPVARE